MQVLMRFMGTVRQRFGLHRLARLQPFIAACDHLVSRGDAAVHHRPYTHGAADADRRRDRAVLR